MYVQDMIPPLIAFSEHEEEVRNVVSECLGRLIAVSPAKVVPRVTEMLFIGVHLNRATMVHALRFAMAEFSGSPLPNIVAAALLDFLRLVSDEDVAVRRASLLALNCSAHNKPSSIRELLSGLLLKLYEQTRKRADLVHQESPSVSKSSQAA